MSGFLVPTNIFVTDIQIGDTTPALTLKDSDCTDSDINAELSCNATDTGSGTEDIDVTLKAQVAGTLTTFLTFDADGDLSLGITGQTTNITTLSTTTTTCSSYLRLGGGSLTLSRGSTGGLTLTDTALTSGGTDDYGLELTRTLNDSGAAGGSDTFVLLKATLTDTDLTGWDDIGIFELTTLSGSSGLWLDASSPLLELYGDDSGGAPHFKLINEVEEDTNSGRESQLTFGGYTTTSVEHSLCTLKGSHEGTGTDQKGKLEFLLNDGDDALTCSVPALTLNSGGLSTILSLAIDREAVSSNTNTDSQSLYLGWDGLAADTITIQTSDITSNTGRIFIIKDEGGTASANPLTIATQGAETIDGQTTYTITDDYGWAWLLSNGTNLFVIAHS